MARSGESQGLQVAVILLTIVAFVLAVSTYVMYTSWEAESKKVTERQNQLISTQKSLDVSSYNLLVAQYVLGIRGSVAEINSLETQVSNSGDISEAKKVLADFQKAQTDYNAKDKNYRNMAEHLFELAVRAQKASVDFDERERQNLKERKDIELREQARTKKAEEAAKKTADDLAAERQQFNAQIAEMKKAAEKNASLFASRQREDKEKNDKNEADIAKYKGDLVTSSRTLGNVREQLKKTQDRGPLYEQPDGEVTQVSQRVGLVWINLGYADGLRRQMTFSVFDHDVNGVTREKAKAKIEVKTLVEPHLSECRIIENPSRNPIVRGDKVFTPAWSPGQQLRFALAGFMDLNDDGLSDRDEIKRIIEMNHGLIDSEMDDDGKITGELSAETRYLVVGARPSEKNAPGKNSKAAMDGYTKIVNQAEKLGVDMIDVTKLLGLMGWKSEERTLKIGQKIVTSGGTGKPGAKAKDKAKAGDKTAEPDAPVDAFDQPGRETPEPTEDESIFQ